MSEEVIVVGLFDFLLVINEREENFMGFVFEKVPEKDWEFFNSMELRDCWGTRKLSASQHLKWSTNREENAYLVGIGGGYDDMPQFYDLWWNGNIIRMEVVEVSSGKYSIGVDIVWNIVRIPIPERIWERRNEVLELIKEAFSVYSGWCKPLYLKSISVNINCEPEMIKEKQLWD